MLLAEAMERVDAARDATREPTGVEPGARAIAWSVFVLVLVSALAETPGPWTAGYPRLWWRGAVFAVAALTQVAIHTSAGVRWSRGLRTVVPLAVVIDALVMSAAAGRVAVSEVAVWGALLAAALVLPWSARWAVWPSLALVAGYAVALAASGPLADTAPLAAVPRPLALALLGAGTPIVMIVGAAVAAAVGERERRRRVVLVADARRHAARVSLAELALACADATVLMERAVAVTCDALGSDAAAIFALAADGEALEFRAGVRWLPDGAFRRLKTEARTLGRYVLDADGPVVCPDLADEKRFAVPRVLKDGGFTSGAAVTIAGSTQPFGMLVTFATQRWTCDADESAFLSAVGHVLTTALGRLDADRALGGEADVATALVRVGRELLALVDTPVLLARACELTAQALGGDHSQIWLLDPEEEAYVPISSHGFDADTWGAIRALRVRTESMAPLLTRLEQERAVEVTTGAHRHPFLETVLLQFGVARALIAPVHRDDVMIGIQLTGRGANARPFTPEQLRLAAGVGRLASIALANARLVETVEHASQLKSEFLSTMSHELRTPLNVIIGYLDMLADEPASPEHTEILGRVRSSSIELLDMIEGTLNLNRIEAGQDIPQLGELSVEELLEELRGEYAVHPRKVDAVLRWQPPKGTQLYSDRRRLKIILKNIIGNALKFTPRGEVVVSCQTTERSCTFTVRDTGIGIPPEQLPVVFEMFRQIDSSESRSYGGAGLGLYIVKRLLDQLGGTIDVESEPGRGSTFRVTLPNEPMASPMLATTVAVAADSAASEPRDTVRHLAGAEGNARQAAAVAHDALPKPPRRQRILYADDLELNRHLLRRFIARHLPDVEFFEASDGAHALAVFEAQHPDLVLLDLRMPKMDGWVAARRLRALDGGRDVPILAVTVTASPGAEAYALHAGCNEFLTKPISDYSVLLARIEYWLGRGSRPAAPGPHEPPTNGGRERPRPEASGNDLVCVLCNQPLPSLSLSAHQKRRQLTPAPVPRA